MPISPDEKSWTWVLERACTECGFDTQGFAREDVGALLRRNVEQWPPLLADPLAARRPDDATWSCIEYGCHVRDVFRIFATRLRRMLDEDGPLFANWDQDATAIEDRYDKQDPLTVSAELSAAGSQLAELFDSVGGDQWSRSGDRSDGSRFTVESFARYFIHDPIHHIYDVEKGYTQLHL